MRLSYPAGHALIFREEAIILVAYNDGYGEWKTHGTIGAGHTSVAGPPIVVPGQRVTLEEAITTFNSDIARADGEVHHCLGNRQRVHGFRRRLRVLLPPAGGPGDRGDPGGRRPACLGHLPARPAQETDRGLT